MSRSTKTILTLVGLTVLIGVLFVIERQLSLRDLVITYKNVEKVSVYKTSDFTNPDITAEPIGEVDSSGEIIKLRGGSYTLAYEGKPGYESGTMAARVSGKNDRVSIDPDYSSSRLESLLDTELPAINQALASEYPRLGLYKVMPGQLYYKADWYGTTLVYIGDDVFNTDALRVVLHKEGRNWKVVTDPPEISLSKLIYPEVPEDILRKVNSQAAQ